MQEEDIQNAESHCLEGSKCCSLWLTLMPCLCHKNATDNGLNRCEGLKLDLSNYVHFKNAPLHIEESELSFISDEDRLKSKCLEKL